ncbi:MAG: tRNA (adenosine(37)-N6)-threonylcarbamoyltransferase complex transferase subunit TsaD [Patescibacteria group bacterium]|jgi:N6-L-threonylcarbamoyladenine synthase
MRILGIETSCDETAVSVLEGEGEKLTVVSSYVRTQIDIHEVYGGVVPEVAAREHLQMLFPMLHKAVSLTGEGIDAIAVTTGPGLAPALRVGTEAAKALAYAWGKPLVPVCHLEGHIYAAWLARSGESVASHARTPSFPALCLIVSGGHTELVLMKGHGDFERLGETLDDAAGEAFDKVAKMLGLGYPGGPKVAQLAMDGDAKAFDFPRAMLDSKNLNMSFSGLKTSVLYTLREKESEIDNHAFRANIAASFQEAIVDVLAKKTLAAIKKHKPVSLILAGGVAANIALRERLLKLAEETGVVLFLPPFEYSLDNAAMIAAAGYFRARETKGFGGAKPLLPDPTLVKVDPNMDIV